jgi:hypothetical protein
MNDHSAVVKRAVVKFVEIQNDILILEFMLAHSHVILLSENLVG